MELINRYVSAVGRRIWGKNRKDIESELKTILIDTLEERLEGRKATDKDVINLLKEFGHPSEIASKYNSDKKYIIGPMLYDLYMLIIKIICIIVPIGITIGSVVDIIQGDSSEVLLQVMSIIPEVITGTAVAIGFVTIIFMLIERNGNLSEEDLGINKKEWDPKTLPKCVREHNQVKYTEKIVSICFIVLFLILFNIGIYFNAIPETWESFFIFRIDVLLEYLPFWNILLVASLVLNLVLIKKGRWDITTHTIDLLISLGNVIIFVLFFTTPDIIDLSFLEKTDMSNDELIKLENILKYVFKLPMIIIIISFGVQVAQKLYLIFTHKND